MTLRFSRHARDRMRQRGISEAEVVEALTDVHLETPGRSADRVNRWGRTRAGRHLRITQYRGVDSFIITVVAPDEEGRAR